MDTSDAANITRTVMLFNEYFQWVYEHPLFKPAAIGIISALVLALVFEIWMKGSLSGIFRFHIRRISDYFEGRKMRAAREKEINRLIAEVITDQLEDMSDHGVISDEEKYLYYRRFGTLMNMRDLLPANKQVTWIDKLKAKFKKETPSEGLTRMLRGDKTSAR